MKHKNKRWIFYWILFWPHLQLILGEDIIPLSNSNFTQTNNDNIRSKDLRNIFSPRMDYNQWKPLGRGDPLKNDPTYDYVPPVLDRVHYWIDPALRKPDPPLPGELQKTEILLLGVSSKKPSTGTAVADSRKDLTHDSFLQFVDGPKFNNQKNTPSHYPMSSSYFPSTFNTKNKHLYSKSSDQRVPYTMLMPPPLITAQPELSSIRPKLDAYQSSTPPTTSAISSTTLTSLSLPQVTVQAANLIYHSSALTNNKPWKSTETSTNLTPNPARYSTKKLKPFKDEVVFHKHLYPPESYINIQFAPQNLTNFPLLDANSDHNINYVTPPPLNDQEVMHRGQVSDDKLEISNTYVKIGKTEAQVHSTAMDNIPILPSDMLMEPPVVFSHMQYPVMTQTPVTLQTLQNMQTMQPPPITMSPIFRKTTNPILQALRKEQIEEKTTESATIVPTTPATTTVASSLTTDPLFKHYKQPAEPLRGPLYLIIQGHSKVKTYGPSKQFHGIKVHETNEIFDDKDDLQVKHLHSYMKKESIEDSSREGRSGNLQTLKHVVQTGLGAIDFSHIEINKRKDDFKETELKFGYKVGEDATSEKYYKGIVEEARKL